MREASSQPNGKTPIRRYNREMKESSVARSVRGAMRHGECREGHQCGVPTASFPVVDSAFVAWKDCVAGAVTRTEEG